VLQHASTVVGTAVVAWWLWRRLERIPAPALPRVLVLSPALRRSTLALLMLVSLGWAGWVAATETLALAGDAAVLRRALRSAGLAAAQGLGLSTIGYAILWRLLR
jgi:hypothetical protein